MVPVLLLPDDDPRHLVARPWGGRRLAPGPDAAGPIGEAWVLSTLPERPSYVGGRPLSSWLDAPLGLLVKLLDTARPLSVQVHPDDGDLGPGTTGKEEAWIVLSAGEGAWIRAGLAPGTSAEELVRAAAGAGAYAAPDVLSRLSLLRPRPGDVVLLPAGVPHTLGPGLFLAEVQQPTDATLRLYDYGRGRPLHLAKAARVLRADRRPRCLPWGGAGTVEGAHLALARGARVEAPAGRPTVFLATAPGAFVERGRARAELPPNLPALAPQGGVGVAPPGGAVFAAWTR